MSTTTLPPDAVAEAVIISGPRKGELVPYPIMEGDIPEEAYYYLEQMESLVQDMERVIVEMQRDSDAWRQEAGRMKQERDELFRAFR